MNTDLLKKKLRDKGLKATPKRLSILMAITALNNHPAAEEIIQFLRNQKLDIATATVYKALDILVARKVIIRVKTGKNTIRYDSILDPHHHLYSAESEAIKDYENKEIDKILESYFRRNKIRNFNIDEIKLQIIGKFRNNHK